MSYYQSLNLSLISVISEWFMTIIDWQYHCLYRQPLPLPAIFGSGGWKHKKLTIKPLCRVSHGPTSFGKKVAAYIPKRCGGSYIRLIIHVANVYHGVWECPVGRGIHLLSASQAVQSWDTFVCVYIHARSCMTIWRSSDRSCSAWQVKLTKLMNLASVSWSCALSLSRLLLNLHLFFPVTTHARSTTGLPETDFGHYSSDIFRDQMPFVTSVL